MAVIDVNDLYFSNDKFNNLQMTIINFKQIDFTCSVSTKLATLPEIKLHLFC